MVRVIQEGGFNTFFFFFSPECSPMLCHGAADSVKTTCRCSVGEKRRNPFEILGTAPHSFLLAQPLLKGAEGTECRWKSKPQWAPQKVCLNFKYSWNNPLSTFYHWLSPKFPSQTTERCWRLRIFRVYPLLLWQMEYEDGIPAVGLILFPVGHPFLFRH